MSSKEDVGESAGCVWNAAKAFELVRAAQKEGADVLRENLEGRC